MNVPKLRLPQSALLFAVTTFLNAGTLVREARWLIPKGEPLLVCEFQELAIVNSQWQSSGDLKIDQAPEAVTLHSKGNDPSLETALPPGTIGPLLVTLRCRANTYNPAQLFWRGNRQGYASIRSTSVPLYPTADFADFTFHLETNATLTHLRLDPFPAAGHLSVQRLTFSRIGLGSPSNSEAHFVPLRGTQPSELPHSVRKSSSPPLPVLPEPSTRSSGRARNSSTAMTTVGNSNPPQISMQEVAFIPKPSIPPRRVLATTE